MCSVQVGALRAVCEPPPYFLLYLKVGSDLILVHDHAILRV